MIGCGRGSFELTGLDDEGVIGRPVREVLGLSFENGADQVGTVLEWGVRAGQEGRVNAEGDIPARAVADSSPPTTTTGAAAGPDPGEVARTPSPAAHERKSRNGFILLLVLGLHRRGGRGDRAQADGARPRPARRRRARLQGRPSAAQPKVTQDALDRAVDIMRKRVDQLGVGEPEIQRSGRDQISVQLPGVRTPPAPRAGRHDGPAGLLRLGSQHPRRGLQARTRTRTRTAKAPITGFYAAATQAAKCPPRPTATTTPPTRRASTRSTRSPRSRSTTASRRTAGGRRSRTSATRTAQRRGHEVPEGDPRRRATRAPKPTARRPDRCWFVQDNPALSARTSRTPSRTSTEQRRQEPIVTFEFTKKGRKAFQDITREIAQRGADNALPGRTRQVVAALRDRARQRAGLGPVHRLQREPGRDRRLERRADLRLVHDRLGAGPGEDPRDRRAADPPRADLALAGLRLARPAGARPGPRRRARGFASSRSS